MSFKKGHSYIRVSDKSNPNHVLTKALIEKGYRDFELIFAPKWSTNFGWEVLEGIGLPTFLGYTKSEALVEISRMGYAGKEN